MANLSILNQITVNGEKRNGEKGATLATFNPKDIVCITYGPMHKRTGECERFCITVELSNGHSVAYEPRAVGNLVVGNEKPMSANALYNMIVEEWQEALINMVELEKAPPKVAPKTK